jgi:8-oxo-dGTP pyrophosphatase MutT (NUDIX family)
MVDLIDAENQVIGKTTRREVRAKNLLHRGVGILCRNSAGQIYVHRRTTTKDVFPGLYDMFVGGVVESGETYVAAARREVLEELGIDGPEPRPLFHHLYQGPRNRSWVAVYEVTWDGPIRHQESEVAWGSYLSMEEILARLEEWEWVPDGLEIFHRYLEGAAGESLPGAPR